jgi:hypothetical protein
VKGLGFSSLLAAAGGFVCVVNAAAARLSKHRAYAHQQANIQVASLFIIFSLRV